ncbi:MAG: superoxide dismutase family protein [Oscillospiraceae bacterium]|nr:superoxide dismutase family protein [Oscillospiraceae bacterium]
MMYPSSYRPGAAAHVTGGRGAPDLNGTVHFRPHRGGVLVTAQITGLPADNTGGFFALHIHEGDSCGGEMFADTGGHYNPTAAPHPRHAGDLPPLLSCNGSAFLSVLTDRFSIEDVVGRTVVIHNGPDDFTSQPAGNAGTKIACGVIYRT